MAAGVFLLTLLLAGGASAAEVVAEAWPERVEERELRGGDELVVRFPQRDVQARWTPSAPKASLPWTRAQGRIVSAGDGEMPLFAFVSQADSNRLTVACSELVRPVESTAYLKYENGSVFEVRLRLAGAAAGRTCRVRLDGRNLLFQTTVAEACDWLRTFPANRCDPPPAAAYEPLWNSWYSYRTGVTAADMEREGAAAAALGIRTLVYDMGWDRPGARDSISFRACGDWIPDPSTFPDFAAHLARQHARGLRCLLWFGYPLLGLDARNFARFRGKCLRSTPDHRGCLTLDPAAPEVRTFVGDALVQALDGWKADGFKIDFIQSFRANGARSEDVTALLDEIQARTRAARPDALVEFMAPYGGIAAHRHCTHVRATDCPGDAVYNRWQTANLRLCCGRTAVHSDMVTWDDSESPETAALQIVSVLHSAIQYGRSLADLPDAHARMVRHWTRFASEHRATLLQGAFLPRFYVQGYPLIETACAHERIVGIYAPGIVADVAASGQTVHVVNGSGVDSLLLRTASAYAGEVFDTYGDRVGEIRLGPGLNELRVPKCGRMTLRALPPFSPRGGGSPKP